MCELQPVRGGRKRGQGYSRCPTRRVGGGGEKKKTNETHKQKGHS